MKFSILKIQNFLGIRHVDLSLGPLNLIAGLNGSGKSSIENAVRLATTGALPRISLKKDLAQLVNEGQKGAVIDLDEREVSISAAGKALGIPNAEDTPWWAHALTDMHYLTSLDATALRKCLFTHSGGTSTEEIEKRLIQGGADKALVAKLEPLLRSFEVAATEATQCAQQARGEWKGITGETYGEVKAETWAADVPKVVTIQDHSAELRAKADRARQKIADSRAGQAQRAAVERSLVTAKEGASLLERRQNALESIRKQIAEIEPSIQALERSASGKGLPEPQATTACPECGSILHILSGFSLMGKEEYDEKNKAKPSAEAKRKLKEQQDAKSLLTRSLENATRDLNAATQATSQVDLLGKQLQELDPRAVQVAMATLVVELNDAETAYNDHITALGEARAADLGARTADDKTRKAALAHYAVKGWTLIKGLLSPDGIPAQFLDGVLKEINERLRVSAGRTNWGQVQVHPDMGITYGGRALVLCSESERWRTNAMLTEAVAFITKEKFVMFDRLDVLGTKQRLVALEWADVLVTEGCQVILLGTLKAKPTLEGVNVWWLENGEVQP